MSYSIGKCYVLDHAQYIVKKMIDCLEQRYGNFFGKDGNVNINSEEGDAWCCLPSELQRLAKVRENRRRKL